MRFRRPAKVDKHEWHEWFAWWPVNTELGSKPWYCWAWLETVERRWMGDALMHAHTRWQYKIPVSAGE